MYLTPSDYANNEMSLLKALKRQQKGSKYRYKDVQVKVKDHSTTVLIIDYDYASNERGGWNMGVKTLWLDSCGLLEDSLLSTHSSLVAAWVEHIKNIKEYRISLIKRELIEKAMNPRFGHLAAKN
jgi:hypothetical protein